MDYEAYIKNRIRDVSEDGRFAYTLDCVCCGETYRTLPIRFEKLLETEENAAAGAYESAIKDFSQILTRCLVCGDFVCERCVSVDERGHLCKSCADKREGDEPQI